MPDGASGVPSSPDEWHARVTSRLESGGEASVPVGYRALEQRARERLDPHQFGFVSPGAGSGATKRSNERAFGRWQIVPRVLRDVSDRTLQTDLFSLELPAPVVVAPVGAQSVLHDEGELATARAAAGLGLPFSLSTGSSRSIEAVGDATGDAPRFFQLYVGPDRELTESFLDRAERSGYDGILLTVDQPVRRSWRAAEGGAGEAGATTTTAPRANYFEDPVFLESLDDPPDVDPAAAHERFHEVHLDPSLEWADLEWLRELTELPIVIKGIVHPDDAARAVAAGVDGIVVSNHGGNHLDGSIPAVEALDAIVDEVDGRVPILFDSGVRSGADAFKALALGADVVCVGRPFLYGLALAGEDGVRAVLEYLVADLDLTMALAGCTSVDAIDERSLVDPGGGALE